MDLATGRNAQQHGCHGRISRCGMSATEDQSSDLFGSPARKPARGRPLHQCLAALNDAALWISAAAQGTPDKTAGARVAGLVGDPQRPDIEPGGADLYRAPARGSKNPRNAIACSTI